VIDMDWHLVDVDPRHGSGWTGYTWNRELFPDPPAFLAALHARGLAVTLNVHPAEGVHAHEERYPAMARRLGVDPASELPLVMAIHGLGDRPENFAPVLSDLDEPARLIVPRGLSAYGDGFSWFPFRGELREEALERGVRASAQALAKALEALQKTRPTRGRPIVTGFSQGGALSFALAVLHPTSVAASIPVGGWVAFPLPKEAPAAPRPPITALHGAADSLIPVSPTRAARSTRPAAAAARSGPRRKRCLSLGQRFSRRGSPRSIRR